MPKNKLSDPQSLDFSKNLLIHTVFESVVQNSPAKIAVTFDHIALTYEQLNQKSNQLANAIKHIYNLHSADEHISSSSHIVLCLPPGIEVITAIIGILKAGATYIPLDIEYPEARFRYILEDTQAEIIITTQEIYDKFSTLLAGKQILCVDTYSSKIEKYSLDNLSSHYNANNSAYIIYTSGSTGKPKGVCVPHSAVINLALSPEYISFTNKDCIAQISSISFDAAVFEIFVALLNGATLALFKRDDIFNPYILAKNLKKNNVSTMLVTTGLFNHLFTLKPSLFDALSCLIIGGEILDSKIIKNLLKRKHKPHIILNAYGPTEGNVITTCYKVEHSIDGKDRISIGKPINGRKCFVLDKNLQEVPIGTPGELYISGSGLANGYLNDPQLTNSKFILHSFDNQKTVRLYKTGDLVKQDSQGNLDFLSRTDEYVKIRDARVDLREVEKQISSFYLIQQCVVLSKKNNDENELIAFIISKNPDQELTKELRKFLSASLPSYSIPVKYYFIDSIPLTTNGKIDRNALYNLAYITNTNKLIIAPKDLSEQLLVQIWKEVFKLDVVSTDDDFFELGGDSFINIEIIAKAYKSGITLKNSDIFKFRTIAAIATQYPIENNSSHTISLKTEKDNIAYFPNIQDLLIPTGLEKFSVNNNLQSMFDMSPLQEGLFFHRQYSPNSDAYMVQIVLDLTGTIHNSLFTEVIQWIFNNIDILRAGFIISEKPTQFILKQVDLTCNYVDITELDHNKKENFMSDFLIKDRIKNFILDSPALMRFTLVNIEKGKYKLIISYHHILLDGWSINTLLDIILYCYKLRSEQKEFPTHKFFQYQNYITWVSENAKSSIVQARSYWNKLLKDFQNPVQLYIDKNKVMTKASSEEYDYASSSAVLDIISMTKIKSFCKKNALTTNTIFQSAWALLLSYHCGKDDVLYGTTLTTSMPNHLNPSNSIGFFINTLPIRIKITQNKSVLEYMQEIQTQILAMKDFDCYSLAQIQLWSEVPNDMPMFENIFIFENYPQLDFNKHKNSFYIDNVTYLEKIHYPLIVKVIANDSLTIKLEYQKDRFSDKDIRCLLDQYKNLLVELVTDSQRSITAVPLLSKYSSSVNHLAEKDSSELYKKTICQLFEETVAKYPFLEAIQYHEKILTYEELNTKINCLTTYLANLGITQGSKIIVCVDRSIEMVVSILSILKIGAIYIPINTDYPDSRLKHICEDTKPTAVICFDQYKNKFSQYDIKLISIDQLTYTDISQNIIPIVPPKPTDLAYIIYTSGSTGKPKGVLINHLSISNVLTDIIQHIGITSNNTMLAITTITFDISILEILTPLIVGSKVIIADNNLSTDGLSLSEYLNVNNIDFMQATPSTWQMLLDAGWKNLSKLKILCGGEALSQKLATNILKISDCIWNLYGPTEATIWATIKKITPIDPIVSIGHPIKNMQCYVLNNYLQELPPNVVGQLYISGIGLASGYLNQSKLTKQAFIDNPFSTSKSKLYKTGDLVKRLDNGELEFISRIDRQIKLRGYRLEPGEIEKNIEAIPAVAKSAVVIQGDDITNIKQLVAFITPKKESDNLVNMAFSLFYFSASSKDNHYGLYINSAKFADQNNFNAIWTPERHFHEVGGQYPNPSVLSAALATITTQVKLRAGSTVLPLHNPIRVAEEWSVVDNLSGGRVGIAFASGWGSRDFCLAPDNYITRKTSFLENIKVVKDLWQSKPVTFKDGTGENSQIEIFPKPIQKELPIWITAAGNPETFREAGKIGANILTHLIGQSIDELDYKIKIYRQTLIENGYSSEQGIVTVMIHTFLDKNNDFAIHTAKEPFCNYLTAHISLIEQASNFVHSDNRANTKEFDLYINNIFERYINSAALIGSPSTCSKILLNLSRLGVNEVACLIDFGIEENLVVNNLKYLNELRLKSLQMTKPTFFDINEQEIKTYLQTSLPSYMIPTSIKIVDALPKTVNRKIDYALLKKLNIANVTTTQLIQPQTPEEHSISNIFKSILNLHSISVKDNFFNLGGHSLLATRVLSQIRKDYQVTIPLRLFFLSPIVEDLAKLVRQFQAENHLLQLVKVNRNQHIPLSFAQQRMWFLHQMEPNSARYHDTFAFEITGHLNIQALEKSFNTLVKRHEILRTSFPLEDNQPYQKIKEELLIPINILNFPDQSLLSDKLSINEKLSELATFPFNLVDGPLIRVNLCYFAENKSILLITIHHIITDGWSLSILLKELSVLYAASINSTNFHLPELQIQYADFSFCQRHWLSGNVLTKHIDYWKTKLGNELPILNLPTDFLRPAVESYHGASCSFLIEKSIADSIKSLASKEKSTLYAFLFAAFNVLLYKYTGQDVIIVGTPIANRNYLEIENLIGFFVNTLTFKSDFHDNPSLRDIIATTTADAIEGHEFQDLPFDQLVKEIKPERNLSHNPIFQTLFVLQNMPVANLELPGTTTNSYDFSLNISRFDLSLEITESSGKINGVFKYKTELFEQTTITRMVAHYKAILNCFINNLDTKISQLQYLSKNELDILLTQWSHNNKPKNIYSNIIDLFHNSTLKFSNKTALIYNGNFVTYAELESKSSKLAHFLISSCQVKSQEYVGISLDRSIEFIISVLAILKCGAIYVPIDPNYPIEQINYMISDAGIKLLLTNKDTTNLTLQSINLNTINYSNLQAEYQLAAIQPNDLAYLMYTSGSTGNPKGIKIKHKGICRLAMDKSILDIKPTDVVCHASSISFDASTFEIFGALLNGATIVIVEQDILLDLYKFENVLKDNHVTTLWLTSALFNHIVTLNSSIFDTIKKLIIGGDVLDVKNIKFMLEKYNKKIQLINGYGPTEATTFTTCYPILFVDEKTGSIPIGKPIDNTSVYILDQNLLPVPIGVWGEIFIAGDGLADGYLNNDDLTKRTFAPNPFKNEGDDRIYRSGDWGRWLCDGNIQYLGRFDNQIKLRGYRIELSAIENIIKRYPGVSQAVVKIQQTKYDSEKMIAYIESMPKQNLHPNFVTDHVQSWAELYQDMYADTIPSDVTSFNTIGWNSSYTGMPIPAEEMSEWLKDIIDVIISTNPKKVLELGCGTGMLLAKIAPLCEKYCGTDFSNNAIEYVLKYVQQTKLQNVTLLEKYADDFSGMHNGEYDTVILNSVVQYFPSIDYLLDIVRKSIEVILPNTGQIIIGDVRNYDLIKEFHASIRTYDKDPASISFHDLNDQISSSILQEYELLISPRFFINLQKEIPQISHVTILLKNGSSDNELINFRYNVILHVDNTKTTYGNNNISYLDYYKDNLVAKDIQNELLRTKKIICANNIPNARVFKIKTLLEWLEHRDQNNKNELFDQFYATVKNIIDPHTLMIFAKKHGYESYMCPSLCAGYFHAIFLPQEFTKHKDWYLQCNAYHDYEPNMQAKYANSPSLTKISKVALKDFLKKTLPNYMIPNDFIIFEKFPLTINGKIDVNMLEKIYSKNNESHKPKLLESPKTDAEIILFKIWSDVLKIDNFGIHDNFFELGGDSIMGIHVISKTRKAGLQLSAKQLYQYQTIAQLAKIAKRLQPILINYEAAEGTLPLTPIQSWFFNKNFYKLNHWNQAFLLKPNISLDITTLQNTMIQLLQHHDSLRIKFFLDKEGWKQRYTDGTNSAMVQIVQLSDMHNLGKSISDISSEMQASLNIVDGPLIKLVLFNSDNINEQRLLFIIHHLIVDAVSWHILLEDFETIYLSIINKNSSTLLKSNLLKAWTEKVNVYSHSSQELEKEINFWKQLSAINDGFPIDYTSNNNLVGSSKQIKVFLDKEQTSLLLLDVIKHFNVKINDILITALLYAYYKLTGTNSLYLEIETYGRSNDFIEMDISRTVGWFTGKFPVFLNGYNFDNIINVLHYVKMHFLSIPNHGVGFGILKYICKNQEIINIPEPKINFNYFGRFDQIFTKNSIFKLADESAGNERDKNSERIALLELNGAIHDGRMQFIWEFSTSFHKPETIVKVSDYFIEGLNVIISRAIDTNKLNEENYLVQ